MQSLLSQSPGWGGGVRVHSGNTDAPSLIWSQKADKSCAHFSTWGSISNIQVGGHTELGRGFQLPQGHTLSLVRETPTVLKSLWGTNTQDESWAFLRGSGESGTTPDTSLRRTSLWGRAGKLRNLHLPEKREGLLPIFKSTLRQHKPWDKGI